MKFVLTSLLIATLFHGAISQIQLDSTVVELRDVVTDLDVPWDMALASDGWVWVTELDGTISRLDPATDTFQEIFQVPDVEEFGFSAGMHSIVPHPDFTNTPHIFVHYLNSQSTSKIVRYTFDDQALTLTTPMDILVGIPGNISHNGSRMVILNDKLFITIGDGFADPNDAQDLQSLNGNVLRMNLDGSVPVDNPITGSLIWSWGHRNPQGLCYANNMLYSSEHGTASDDEVNIIEMERNYGWPDVEGYCDLPSEMTFCLQENVKEPIWTWSPSVAPCGIDHYNSTAIPEWENSLLVAILKDKQLIQLKLDPDGLSVAQQNIYLTNVYGRIRDVLTLPDGRVLICTSNHDFAGSPNTADDRIIELKAQDQTVGTHEMTKIGFALFPNPASGICTVRLDAVGQKKAEVCIKDLAGRLLINEQLNGVRSNIDLSTLPAGKYFVEVRTRHTVWTKPLIVTQQ